MQSPSPLLYLFYLRAHKDLLSKSFSCGHSLIFSNRAVIILGLFVGHRICIIGAVRSFVASLATTARDVRDAIKRGENQEKINAADNMQVGQCQHPL